MKIGWWIFLKVFFYVQLYHFHSSFPFESKQVYFRRHYGTTRKLLPDIFYTKDLVLLLVRIQLLFFSAFKDTRHIWKMWNWIYRFDTCSYEQLALWNYSNLMFTCNSFSVVAVEYLDRKWYYNSCPAYT